MIAAASTVRETERLAIFLPSLEAGGAEGVMTVLANWFAEQGVAVELLLARKTGHLLDRVDERIDIVELGGGTVRGALVPLAARLRRRPPTTLLSAMTHANVIACLAAEAAPRHSFRLVLSERMSLAARDHFYRSIGERILMLAMRAFYRRAQAIIVPAQAMKAPLARRTGVPEERIHAIANPLPADYLERARQPWPLGSQIREDGGRIVLAVGRLTAVKDYPNLIRAFAQIGSQPHARLVILGEGEERANLERLVRQLGLEGRIFLPGYLADPFPAMAQADVFVLSSRFEGLPNVLIQALACGARVVSTDCPTGPREVLDDGRWGLLVPVGDPKSLSEAIASSLANCTERREWPKWDGYSLTKIAGDYSRVLFPG